MEYFIIALIAVMWGWREFVKSMRLNTIEQELEGIRIWTEKKDQQFLEIQNQVNVLVQKVEKKQNDDIKKLFSANFVKFLSTFNQI